MMIATSKASEVQQMKANQVWEPLTQPEWRTKALLAIFGWQGGTIHQLADETGCKVHDLLYAPLADSAATDADHGWFAARTCTIEHNLSKVFPQYKGNLGFWHGAIGGMIYKLHEL